MMDIKINNFMIGGGTSSLDKYILFVLHSVSPDNVLIIDVNAILSFSSSDFNCETLPITFSNSLENSGRDTFPSFYPLQMNVSNLRNLVMLFEHY